jgi:hypothetical protein
MDPINSRRQVLMLRSVLASFVFIFGLVWGAPSVAYAKGTVPVFDINDKRPAPVISVLTMGPGDEAFFKFGHNAIRVRYPGTTHDQVYNFGTFQFDSPTLILDFLTGKFRYWLSVQSFESTVRHYRLANRSVYEQELDLAPYQARTLADDLRKNALPENRYYLYDYYRDNCSTRIRDAINDNLNDALQNRFKDRGQMTLRDHTLRATAGAFWVYAGLDIAMGSYIDQPETRWGEMFLPEKLMQGLQSVVFTGPHGSIALVKDKRTLVEAVNRPGLLAEPPNRTLNYLQGGFLLGGLFAFLGSEASHRRLRWARVTLGVLTGIFGLCAGAFGTLFVLLWAFTNHQVAFHNENILQCAPWALVLAGLSYGIARGRLRSLKLAKRFVYAGLAAALLGLVAKALPFMEQQNYRVMAALIPSWAGLALGITMLERRLLKDQSRPPADENTTSPTSVPLQSEAN